MGSEVVLRTRSGRPVMTVDPDLIGVGPGGLDLGGSDAVAFTPVLGGAGGTSGQTYSAQSGICIRHGRLCFVQARVVLTAKGVITGNAQIQGLPFAPTFAAPLDIFWLNVLVNKVGLASLIAAGAFAVDLFGLAAAGASPVNLVTADIANNTEIEIGGCFGI